MKQAKRLLSMLLLCAMLLPMLPVTALTVSADTEKSDAMAPIKADDTLDAYRVGETQSYDSEGYIGIPYDVTVYYDYETHGKAQAGYVSTGATGVLLYVINTNTERVGTKSDVDIIKSMLARGYAVVVADYKNSEKAKSPALDTSVYKLRNKAKAGDYFKDATVFASGKYDDTLPVPAGYDVRMNDVYFELDKHGVDGTMEEIVNFWNNDFRGTKASYVIKWVHADGTRKATQNGPDGSAPVWYADAAGTTVDAANGQYIRAAHTKAETITDCVKPDGSPIDLNLYMHTIYPTSPEAEVPVVVLYSSAGSLTGAIDKEERPQFAGFLFSGYAGAIADYAYIPMGRADHNYGSTAGGDATGGATGINMTYATYTYNATQSASAALRMLRYLALSEPETYGFDVDHIGAYGISKTAWYTQLGDPTLRSGLITKEEGLTDLEVAERVNDKINAFVQLLLPAQASGRTRYDNGKTADATVDGVKIDGGELQPWAVYDGAEISSGVQVNYSSCGGFVDYFREGYAPQFITENLQDTANTEYGQQNIMVNLCRTMNIPALWYEANLAHTFATGLDYNYGVDIYDALFRFFAYYLKDTPVSVSHTTPAEGGVIKTTDAITVKFIGEVSVEEIAKATVTDADGNAVKGTWTGAYGDTEWTFTPVGMKGATEYTLTLPATLKGKNGEAMGADYTVTFHTRPEGESVTLSENATLNTAKTAVTLTKPAGAASGYVLRVLVNNDAANTLVAYDSSNAAVASVRVSGKGYYELDLTDALADATAGESRTFYLATANASGNVPHYTASLDSDNGGFTFKFSEVTTGVTVDGAKALKIVRVAEVGKGGYSVYPNMENSFTLGTSKLIKGGAAVTKEDLGRTFLIKLRLYDTVSRPVRLYLNNATSRPDKQIDHDRVYYTAQTVANAWTEIEFPYTVYEMKYGLASQVKNLFVQLAPVSGIDGAPVYLDELSVEEVFTDVSVASAMLVSEKACDKTVLAPQSEMPFSIGSTSYATWKDAMNAAASGATVKLLRNYTLTDADIVSLGDKTTLTVDLGGYRLTAANTKNAPLWVKATNASATALTLKNGSVILSDTPLVGYGSSTSAGSGKTVDVTLEDLYITFAESSASLNILTERTATAGVKIESAIHLVDTDIDLLREHLPDKTMNGLAVLPAGENNLTLSYTVAGGTLTVNSLHETLFSATVIAASEGETGGFTVRLPASMSAPAASFKLGSDYASLSSSRTENGYRVYDVVKAKDSTPYGAIPESFSDVDAYPFAIFHNEAFVNGAADWKIANDLVRELLNANPGDKVELVLRRDWTSGVYIGNSNWLCYMNGEVLLDLGGHTFLSSQSLFEAGVDAKYTGSYDTAFTVRNGTVLVGGGNMCGAQQSSNYSKYMDILFEDVTFGLDETFQTKRNSLFYGQNNNSVTGLLTVDLTVKNCTIDLRGVPCAYTVFSYGATVKAVKANVTVSGVELLTDADTIGNITWYTAASDDTVLFVPDENGNHATLSVTSGTVPNVSLPTGAGNLSFTTLISEGEDYDVYTLTDDSVESKYGPIPSASVDKTFAIFTGGRFVGGEDTWKNTLTVARETLAKNPGSEVQILLRGDREVTEYVGSGNWLSYMQGSILVDLDGHTLTAKTTSLFEAGADKNYTGTWATSLTVKNGSLVQVNGNFCGVQNASAQSKTFDFTFENVDITVDPAGNKAMLFYGQTNCVSPVDFTLTLTDCEIDLTGVTRAYKLFSFASNDTFISADITVAGGKILADGLDTVTLSTMDTANDTFVWGQGSDGAYTTLSLHESNPLSATVGGVSTDGIYVSFGAGVTADGRVTYTLVEDPLVTKYGIIAESAKDRNAYPFVLFDTNGNYVGAGSDWNQAQLAAQTYLDQSGNAGKKLYALMRIDQSCPTWLKSSGIINGTLILDLDGKTLCRGANSFLELCTNGLTEAQCAYTTTIIVKNGYVYAGKSSSGNGHIVAVQSHGAWDKSFVLTFENVTFGVSKDNFDSSKGLSNLILCDNANASGATGKIDVDLTLRNCTVDMTASDVTVVPASTRLFYGRVNDISIVIEGGSYVGTLSGVTFLGKNSTSSPITVAFNKGSDGKYFYFDVTAGTPPTEIFDSELGEAVFAKSSGNLYTLAVRVPEFGNAFIPLDQYEDTETYPFIAYADGTLISVSKTWKAAQEAVQKYLESHNGETAYVKMRRDVDTVEWFKSAGVFHGTIVLDLGGYTLCRKDNSFLELCTNGLSAEQCTFVTNVVIRNGKLLAGKPTNNGGHIVALQSNNAFSKSYNVTFKDVTFGISKENYSAEKGLFAVVIRENGATSGATGMINASILFDGCIFDFTDSENTAVPATDTTVIHTNPASASANIDITFKGGELRGTHQKVSFLNASDRTTVTYVPDENGEYFSFDLTAGTPSKEAVTTDKGDGYFYSVGNGKWNLGIGRAAFTGASVLLGKDLSLLYSVRIHDVTLSADDLAVRFTLNGKSVTVREYTTLNGEYIFTLDGIAPQQMGDLIDAEILVGESVIASHKGYSIKENLKSLLSSGAAELGISEEKHAAMKTLIADLLTYGAAAQIYTGYATDSPVTDGVEGLAPSTVSPTEQDAMILTGNQNPAAYFGKATVHFDTVNSIRVTVVGITDAANVTVKVDGVSYRLDEGVKSGEGLYVFSTDGILATGFDSRHVFELLVDGETVSSLSYSVNAYAYAMISGGAESDSMQDLAFALYRYGVSADAYAEIA